jgi:O-antigen ligase
MTLSATPVRHTGPALTPLLLTALSVGVVLSPWSTKLAGAVWLVWCLWGIALRLAPRMAAAPERHPAMPAVHAWAAGCVVALGLAMVKAGYWGDAFDEVYAYLRLVLSAAAAWWVLSRTSLPRDMPGRIGDAVAGQCAVAFLVMAWLMWKFPGDPRNLLPANAIVWAHAVAFGLCLLMPLLLCATDRSARRRAAWWLGAALGCGAVLMSQSRGAYGVFAWMGLLLAMHWRDVHGCWPVRRLAILAVGACVVMAAVWWAPGDPFKMRKAEHEIAQAETNAVYDTSLGIRLYLWNMAWQGLLESPLVGVGETERLRRIKHAGIELPEPQREKFALVRGMGHVHNQFLHVALDGGVMGLGAVLALIAGLATAAWRLRKVDRLAARQMAGLLFAFVAGGLTNVNLAHNYYVVSLAVFTAAVLVGARNRVVATRP